MNTKISIFYFLAFFSSLLLITGCVQQVSTGQRMGEDMMDEEFEEEMGEHMEEVMGEELAEEMEEEMEEHMGEEMIEEMEEMMGEEPQSVVKEFTMTAKRWEFTPSTITVNEGDTVKLTITSTDVTHGFNLPDFGVNKRLEPGTTVNIEFVADKTGTFTFKCNVPCGSGHSTMNGKLIVE